MGFICHSWNDEEIVFRQQGKHFLYPFLCAQLLYTCFSTLILFIAHQVFRMKVEEVLSGKTVCYVLVYCLPVEKVDATVRIECVVMDTSRIGTRVCIMYVCSMRWGFPFSSFHPRSDAEKSNMGLLFVLLSILMLKAEPVTEGKPHSIPFC